MKYIYNNKKSKKLRNKLRNGQTDAEILLWSRIRNRQINGYRFVRQYSVGKYIIDFYCQKKRLGIELDGGQHNDKEKRIYDEKRTKYLEELDIKILRFWNNEVMKNTNSVLEKISIDLKQ